MKRIIYLVLIILLVSLTSCVDKTEFNIGQPEDTNLEFNIKQPEDANLEFWIKDNVSGYNFSEYESISGIFGAHEVLDRRYKAEIDEYGNTNKPKYYISYVISSYPDYATGIPHVTEIQITDPEVTFYGLTVKSSQEEIDQVMEQMSFTKKERGIVYYYQNGDIQMSIFNDTIRVWVTVTNETGIDF